MVLASRDLCNSNSFVLKLPERRLIVWYRGWNVGGKTLSAPKPDVFISLIYEDNSFQAMASIFLSYT